jgi:hypothetical protein
MTTESTVLRQVWLALGSRCRLFRVNTGKAWVCHGEPRYLRDGSVVLPPGSRPVPLGLSYPNGDPVSGTPDLVGWSPVVVTADMVGRTLPVFTGVEVKASSGGRRREAQINFVEQLIKSGGIAGFASSADRAHEIIDAWQRGESSL